ncbi:diguanylate cyclase regulator RdcB family protein [Escherichia coli]
MTSPFIQQIADNRVCQVLTCLPEKFVVDFANGIDVAQEHIRTAGERTFFRRLKEGLTGEGAARQNAINASLAQGVEASLRWLTEMTTSLATTNYAITQVNDRVSSLVSDTARLAHYSADTREQLLTLADQVHHKLNHLEEKLHRVDQVQRAQLHLEQIFSWWSAGRYASFSPAGRCYVALEELRWGAFGDVIRQSETGQVNQLLDILRHKALTQMAQEIVTHLSDGSLWDRQAFPDTTILEIRPRKRLKYAGDGGNSGGLLSFTSAHTDAWRQQGYEDTMLAMEHIRKPLAARQALTRSEAVLQKSLDITEEADLALRNAMARIK